jgi:uncharacterized membrane protein
MKQIIFFLSCLFLSFTSLAQAVTNDDATMASTMRSNGKIYVVVAVLLTILIGLILYLINIDRKISKLENEN